MIQFIYDLNFIIDDKIEDSQNNIIKMDDETMARSHSQNLLQNGNHKNGQQNGKKRVYSESNHHCDIDDNNDNRLTVSQPFLNDRNSDHGVLKGSQKNLTMSRPDILYQVNRAQQLSLALC